MQVEGAVIEEGRVTFAVVIVKKHVLDNRHLANDAVRAFGPAFAGLPIVLMAQDSRGRATYFGRPDLSKFMASVPLNAVPWSRYTIN